MRRKNNAIIFVTNNFWVFAIKQTNDKVMKFLSIHRDKLSYTLNGFIDFLAI